MKESELYRRSETVLSPYLMPKGFGRTAAADYHRRIEGGEDRILVSKGPPSRAESHFAVFLSYYPKYLNVISDLVDIKGSDFGFPVGPYLSPAGVIRRPKYWSCKDVAALDASLQQVVTCLGDVGIPWLESLSDPKVYAENVDPAALLPAGIAYEEAGDTGRACQQYSEMIKRLQLSIERFGEEDGLGGRAKAFIFLAGKLGVEHERRLRLERQTGFSPNISPIC